MSRAEIQPELWVPDAAAAPAFYEEALGAVVEHRVGAPDDPHGMAQLSVEGARFWRRVAGAAVAAGATATSPVSEEHGWLVGRIRDPFGHEWEIGRPLGAWPP